MHYLGSALVLAICIIGSHAIPVDNGVEGDPEIFCGPTSIQVNFNTANTFEGHVFVKTLYDQDVSISLHTYEMNDWSGCCCAFVIVWS